MTKILHLSDLHFGKHFLPEAGEAVLAQVDSLSPDIIVISGDFTHRAKPGEFEAALKFMQRLPPKPQVVVPGNHDVPLYRVWERMLSPHALYQHYIAGTLDSKLNIDNGIIVGLDSTAPYSAIKNGRLSRKQLQFCEDAFADAPEDAFKMVVMHHHLVPAPTFERTRPMPQAKRTLEAFTRMRVDVVLAGHLHRAYVGHSLDVYAGENRNHGIIIVQCGTTTSCRGRGLEREKNSFNLVTLSATNIQVEHYHYLERSTVFKPVSRHIFKRQSNSKIITA
ncbi:3',5'-cyclic AMP phosphodiesterase CpdA [Nitrosomonas sp. Nm51]|uniref:metallophosphoesterase family protein n=1 Tax=Nitrosomonas sp. Nm51 TaxID=133720 RepID=UPI0008B3E42F|nr:metallophosphoesterase [Nitrosomonas sp. Nm51]SEQ86378.1 3',5'-cyclic AMP phosphodiesterase CpdA [Nitrosomonas sp. Nm51]